MLLYVLIDVLLVNDTFKEQNKRVFFNIFVLSLIDKIVQPVPMANISTYITHLVYYYSLFVKANYKLCGIY